ncbi:MAG: hypothetical protein ACFB8W_04740 [Elainellaceae cyanobacterium]
MTRLDQVADADVYNQQAVEKLARAIAMASGEFALVMAHCNYQELQRTMMRWFRQVYPAQICEVTLTAAEQSLLRAVQAGLQPLTSPPDVVMVFGLEAVADLPQLLKATNQVRDEFRKLFPFPLVLWVTDEVLRHLIRLAPDFQSWATLVDFQLSTAQLVDALRRGEEALFNHVLEVGVGRFFCYTDIFGDRYQQELPAAERDLAQRSKFLEPNLQASLEFVRGREAYAEGQLDQALGQYTESLDYWEQTPDLKRQACLLYSLGLLWRTRAERNRAQHQTYCEEARAYFERCIAAFEQAHQPQLTARFINVLGDTLQRLEDWNELDRVAQRAVQLHQQHSNLFRLARAYGFLSEVAIARQHWELAKTYAKTALTTLDRGLPDAHTQLSESQRADIDWERSFHQGWYLLALARSQLALGEVSSAILSLETAREETKPQYDPELYISILNRLREVYFQQKNYRDAFEIRQRRRAIEYQFGFRAFLGASRLRPKQAITNPAIALENSDHLLTQEIDASGRRTDIDHLIERMGRSDYRLTVIHGQSGVGKSSILQAGFVPNLKQTTIGSREVLPVVEQVYADWLPSLGQALMTAIGEHHRCVPRQRDWFDSEATILQQLYCNSETNLITVLIFDQFEEFFYVCKDSRQRRGFYQFLKQCLNVPFVKVIISVREDYLHKLLEMTRLVDFDVINNNVLDKSILYYLGNFSREEARSVIHQLTHQTPFSMEPDLVDRLVEDLAGELEEVSPIELQVVGAQLQTEQITTLQAYHERGPKEKLVTRYLEAAIENCGPENQKTAKQILYALTDEQNTRPLRTWAELAEDAEVDPATLDMVLTILVGAGLVFELPEASIRYYQLVHDYLVPFLRQGQEPELQAALQQTKAQLKQALWQEQQERRRAEIAEINALNALAQALLLSNDHLGALVTSVKAARNLAIAQAASERSPTPLTSRSADAAIPAAIARETTRRLRQTLANVREVNRLEGHEGTAFGVTFSPDGALLASASADHTVRLWDVTGRSRQIYTGHRDHVFGIAFSPDGTLLASASADRTVRLWRRRGGAPVQVLKGHSKRVFSVAFSPNGQLLASASEDGTVQLWDRQLGWEPSKTFQRGVGIYSVTFSPDGQTIAAACEGGKIRLWQLDGNLLREIKGHDESVFCIAYSPDGDSFASAGADGRVKLWSRIGEELGVIQQLGTMAFCLKFSPDSQMLAVTTADGIVRLCNLQGQELQTFRGHSSTVFGVGFSPDGRLLASTGEDQTVRIWSLSGIGLYVSQGHRGRILDASLSADGQILASAGEDHTVKLWRVNGELLKTLCGHDDIVRSVCFSPDGRLLASASNDRTVKLWRTDGTLLKTYHDHFGGVRHVSFSPDGQLIVSAGNDRILRLWRLDGTLVQSFYGHRARIPSVSFSPDGEILASASGRAVMLWRLSGDRLALLEGHSARVLAVSFSPDGQLIASASADKSAKLWHRNGHLLRTFRGHEASVRGVCFSPDGQWLVSFGADCVIKIWSLDGSTVQTLTGHLSPICAAGFVASSQTLVSFGENSLVKGWQIRAHNDDRLEEAAARGSAEPSILPSLTLTLDTPIPNIPTEGTDELDALLVRSCHWLKNYLTYNQALGEGDRHLCDPIL